MFADQLFASQGDQPGCRVGIQNDRITTGRFVHADQRLLGRAQHALGRALDAAGREMIEFKSAFARKGDVEAEEMLAENSKLPLATIALSGEVYLVVYNALLSHLDMEDFDFCLSRVAAVADTLEEKYARQDTF